MKRWCWLLVLAGVVCTVLGCVPRRLFWSPDGLHGAVIGEDRGLYLCDPAGKLSQMIAPEVGVVAWFADSRRLIAARGEEAMNWKALEPVISKDRREAIINQAAPFRAEILAYEGDWKQFQPKSGRDLTPGELAALVLYVRDHDDGSLAKRLQGQGQDLAKLNGAIYHLQVYELVDGGARPGDIIYSSVDAPADMRVSPDGKWLATTVQAASHSANLGRLLVMPIQKDARPVVVAENVSAYSDFSPDSAYLYYGRTEYPAYGSTKTLYSMGTESKPAADQSNEGFTLGTLSRRKLVDEAGKILSPLPAQEDLVGVIFWDQMKVRCLRDGRILFSSCDLKLPATTAEMPKTPNLFFIDPARQATVTRVLPAEPGALVEGLGMGGYELSPDQQRVVVIGASNKAVAVITLATGKIETVFPAERTSNELGSVPVWRTSDEVAFFVPAGVQDGLPDKASLMLYKLGGQGQCISKDWPSAVVVKPASTQPPGQG